MIDPELQSYLSGINQHLVEIKKNQKHGIWRSFFNGMLSAFGYLFGLAFVIVMIGWILNKTGTLPAFKEELRNFNAFITQARLMINSSSPSTGQSGQQGSGASGTTITLPNGQQVHINQQP